MRSNDDWLRNLGADATARDEALEELRVALLRGLARALGGRVDDSLLEDAVQDSLMRILDRLDQFEGRSRFLTWATSIAVRTAMNELRRRRWKDVSLDDVLERGDPAGDPPDPREGPAAAWERRAAIARMLEVMETDLTARQKAALVAELRGMPQDEIARHLGSNRNAVYKLAHDARKRLRRGLEDAGFRPGDLPGTATGDGPIDLGRPAAPHRRSPCH